MQWSEVEELLIGLAADDLADSGEVRAALVAFSGPRPLALSFLRPVTRAAHGDALLELLAFLCPMGADRLAFSAGARAWSLDDPIAPVLSEEEDLRQRVVVVHTVDASEGLPPSRHGVLWPFFLEGPSTAGGRPHGPVCWGKRLDQDAPEGPLPDALAAAVSVEVSADAEEVRDQIERCLFLGHEVYLFDGDSVVRNGVMTPRPASGA